MAVGCVHEGSGMAHVRMTAAQPRQAHWGGVCGRFTDHLGAAELPLPDQTETGLRYRTYSFWRRNPTLS